MTLDELTVTVEALREYRLRVEMTRRAVIDNLIIRLMVDVAKGTME